jgi:hypothetical protein
VLCHHFLCIFNSFAVGLCELFNILESYWRISVLTNLKFFGVLSYVVKCLELHIKMSKLLLIGTNVLDLNIFSFFILPLESRS